MILQIILVLMLDGCQSAPNPIGDKIISSHGIINILGFAPLSFRDCFDFVRKIAYLDGSSMSRKETDFVDFLTLHDAFKDDNFALRNWFDLQESDKEKLDQIKRMLKNPTIDFTIEDGYVLTKVVEFGDLEVVKNVMNKLILNNQDPSFDAVIAASKKGYAHIVKYLMIDERFQTSFALRQAAIAGDLNLVKYLVEACGINPFVLILQRTALGSVDVAEYIVEEAGVEPVIGFFLESLGSGNEEVATYLYSKMPTSSLNTVHLSFAVRGGNNHLIRMVSKNARIYVREVPDLISGLMFSQNLWLLMDLEKEGNDKLKITAENLIMACYTGNLEMVKYLVDVHKLELNQNSLFEAVRKGKLDLLTFIIDKHGVIPTEKMLRNVKRSGPGLKSRKEYYGILDFLRKKLTEDIKVSDSEFSEIMDKNADYAYYLLEKGIYTPNQDFFDSSPNWRSALYAMEHLNFKPNLELLRNAALRGNVIDFNYLTHKNVIPDLSVLDRIVFSGNMHLFKLAIGKYNLKPEKSTLLYACSFGHADIARIIIQHFKIQPDHVAFKAWDWADVEDNEFLMYLVNAIGLDEVPERMASIDRHAPNPPGIEFPQDVTNQHLVIKSRNL